MIMESQEKLVARPEYLAQMISFKEKPLIKVVTGIRRCGKSKLMELYQRYLLENGVEPRQIVAVNLELLKFAELKDYMALYNYITERLCKDKFTYVFIDEVQECKEFERVVDSLHITKNVDVYVTGSNAKILSGELATLISGRYITIKMLPLSFKEYVEGVKLFSPNNEPLFSHEYFKDYVRFSSFPLVLQLENDDKQIREYLDGLYTTIFKKDMIERYKIKDEAVLEAVTRFVYDNIGNVLSPKKISDTLTSGGRKTTQPTVEKYISYLIESFMVHEVTRYDIKGKQHLKSLSKYYVADIGLRNYLLGYKDTDRGHILENVIYLELLRRGYKVQVGKVGDTEVDFVATKQYKTIYIQVAESIVEKSTFIRELAPLKAIKDFHARVLITNDYDINENYDGIRHLNTYDFLLGKVDIE